MLKLKQYIRPLSNSLHHYLVVRISYIPGIHRICGGISSDSVRELPQLCAGYCEEQARLHTVIHTQSLEDQRGVAECYPGRPQRPRLL